MVEVREHDGKVRARMSEDQYLEARAAKDPLVASGVAVFVHECQGCKAQHDLCTFEEYIAAKLAAQQFSDACVVGAARGNQ